ncbi:protein RNA-directed DNA methylation 3 [Phoenix dactylifera]|uniref:Protein RNA-directed DNA methylation 3 n=1 Tax=Phoenix dactylifera TaxID=42345 RepID=A0A8B7C8R7_PHODC|nr:protein RNA-directed DNA methylation 3 [Phoenix dactylifera]
MASKGKGKQVAGKAPDAAALSSSSGKRKKPAAEAGASGGRRKKRPGVLQFFDDAAVDADSDDEDKDLDLEEEDAHLDFMDASKSVNDVRPVGKSHPLPFFLKEEELSGDELEALIKDRYGHGSEFVVYNEDSKERDDRVSEVDSLKDPSVWRVKCMVGRERQIAFCFMQKYIDLNNFGNKIQIISAFALDHVKGYVFIEADKEYDVTEACKGFYSVYSSKINRVHGSEVPQLFSSRSKSCEVSEGSWVRMKSGKYKGDLAQVVAVDDGQKKVMVKLVPRVDLQAISKKFGGGVSLKQAAVPAPRLISSHELEMFRPHIEVRRDRQTGEIFEILDGLMLKDGFLYKRVSIGSVICWGVQPSDMELLKFSSVGKDGDEHLNWVSSVYHGRNKMRPTEAADQQVLAKKGNGFNLHDFVLFGHKAFGVIIAVEKDGFRILKGGVEGPEVVTVKIQDIKSACVDKMFTASDRYMKTISINDTVKVLEGPLQDKQGIVKHMYKGTLFIYDENETENSGFFCAKSASCENMKESKGEKSSHSFSQAPMGSYEEQDRSHGFNWRRQTERDQVFSIGQTLRIRKGPLKGYLCRVVGVYRSDVTVKVDSLVKIITVEAEYLSVPNVKRDDSAATTSNPFGTQERLSIGQHAENGQWDVGVPSFGRDSWQAFPASNFSDVDNNGHKADEGHDADPWGSKVISGARADAWHSSKAMDGWGKAASSSGEQDSQWNMTAAGEKVTDQARNCIEDADGWNGKALAKTSTEIDGSKKSKPQSGGDGGWGRGNFGSGNNLDPSENVTGNWDKQRADNLGDSLKNSDGVSGWDRAATSKDKGKDLSWDRSNNWTRPEVVSNDKVSSWDVKGKGIISNEDDSWGKAASTQEKNTNENWGKFSVGSGQIKEKDATRSDGGEQADRWDAAASNWTQSAVQHGGQSSSWDKARNLHAGRLDNWGKSNDKSEAETRDWNKSGFSSQSQNARREEPKSFGGDKPGGLSSSWDKAKDPHGGQSDNWGEVNETSEAETGGWSKAGFSNQSENVRWDEPQNARWDGSTSFGGDNAFNWRKAVDGGDRMDNWKKPRNFEGGHGFGQGRGRGWNAGESGNKDRDGSWNTTVSSDGSQKSSWGKGWDRNIEAGGDGGQENNWNQQRGSDGGRGSGWGGGRGRYGSRGGRGQDDNWNGPGPRGGWGSARGGGRGRNGGGDNASSFDGTRSFDRGRGRGRGHGWVQSSNLKDDQGYCWDGAFQKNPSSGWAGNKTPGSGKSEGFSEIEESTENVDHQGGLNGRKSFDTGCSSGWGGQLSDWKKDEAGNNSRSSPNSNWKKEASVKDAAGGGDDWNMSNRSGRNQSGWDKWSSGNEQVGKAGAGSMEGWNSSRPSDKKQYCVGADKTLAGNEEACRKTVGGQEHEADPWGSKVAYGARGDAWNSRKAADNWGKATGLCIEEISPLSKATVGERAIDVGQDGDCPKDADGWNRTFKSGPGIDGCEKAEVLPSMDAGQSWDKAEISKDKGKGVSWDKPSSWACPEVSNDKADVWDIKDKGLVRNEVDVWGKSSKCQENNNETKDWGSNSSQNREDNKFIGGNKANNLDAAASHGTQSAARGGQSSSWDHCGQTDNWGKAREKNEAEAGGWSKTGFSSQIQNARWDETKSFGGDNASNWSKGIDNEDAFRNGRPDNWNKPRNFEGGCGFGRGRGRGRNAGASGNKDLDGNWNKPLDREGGQRSSWGRGRDGNNEAGGGRGQESNWNRQRDFGGGGGGRGSSWGRGSGRTGARGGRGQGDKWNEPEDKEWGLGSSRGGGWGRNGAGDERNDSDGRQSYGRGRGGRDYICFSNRNEEQENFGDGTFPKASTSNWANDQSPGWGKLDKGKSFDAGGSSGWSKQSSDGNKDGASNNWNSPDSSWNHGASVKKPAGGGDNWNVSDPGGSHSSDRDKWSSGNEQAGRAGVAAEGGWNGSKPSGKEHSFGRGDKTLAGDEEAGKKTVGSNNGGNNWNTTKAAGGSRSSAWDKSSAGNEEAVAAEISSKAKEDEGSGRRGSGWEKAPAAWAEAKDGSAGNGGW